MQHIVLYNYNYLFNRLIIRMIILLLMADNYVQSPTQTKLYIEIPHIFIKNKTIF